MRKENNLFILLAWLALFAGVYSFTNPIDSLKQELSQTNNKYEKASYSLDIADHYLQIHPDSSLYFCRQAISYLDTSFSHDNRTLDLAGRAYTLQGIAYDRLGGYNQAGRSLNKAVFYYKEAGEILKMNQVLVNTGIIHKSKGNYEQALFKYRKALDNIDAEEEPSFYSSVLINLGVLYYDLGLYDKSFKQYSEALAIKTELNEEYYTGRCFYNLGLLFEAWHQPSKSIRYYLTAMEIFENQNDQYSIAYCKGSIGDAYLQMEAYEKAQKYYKEAAKIHRQLNNQQGIAENALQIGKLFELQGFYDSSLNFYKKSLIEYTDIEYPRGEVSALIRLGEGVRKTDHPDSAMYFLDKAQLLAKQLKNISQLNQIFKIKAEIFKELSQYDKAYFYLNKYHEYEDSVFHSSHERLAKSEDILLRYNTQDLEEKVVKFKVDNERLTKEKKIYLIGFFLMVLLTGALLYMYIRKKKKATKSL